MVSFENDNVVKFPSTTKALAVVEAPVYDLTAARQARQSSGQEQAVTPKCSGGVCSFEWKPKKPAA